MITSNLICIFLIFTFNFIQINQAQTPAVSNPDLTTLFETLDSNQEKILIALNDISISLEESFNAFITTVTLVRNEKKSFIDSINLCAWKQNIDIKNASFVKIDKCINRFVSQATVFSEQFAKRLNLPYNIFLKKYFNYENVCYSRNTSGQRQSCSNQYAIECNEDLIKIIEMLKLDGKDHKKNLDAFKSGVSQCIASTKPSIAKEMLKLNFNLFSC